MKVRTVVEHSNLHPPTFIKARGRIYDLPDSEAKRLIGRGTVEAHSASDSKAKRVSRAGKGAGAATASNGPKRPAKGGKGSAGAAG